MATLRRGSGNRTGRYPGFYWIVLHLDDFPVAPYFLDTPLPANIRLKIAITRCKDMVRRIPLLSELIKKSEYRSNNGMSIWRIAVGVSVLLLLGSCNSVEKIKDDISARFDKGDSQTGQSLATSGTEAEAVKSEREVLLSSIQTGLDKLGYGPGRTDGKMDSQTEAAIQDFQLDNDLRINGRASKGLLDSIQSKISD